VRRSGTTLVQRLLCSAPNTLIYGEGCANELSILVNILLSRQMQFRYDHEQRDQLLQRVLDGHTDEWIADLMPEMKGYMERLQPSYLKIFDYYRSFAEEQGRPVWGCKMAEWTAPNLVQAMRLFTQAKLIYIYRPLAECVRSAKKLDLVRSGQDIQQYAQHWLHGLHYVVQNIDAKQLLLLDYVELVERPEAQLKRIEAFSGAEGIKMEVMNTRVNTFGYDRQEEQTAPGYLPPSQLSEEEEALLKPFQEQLEIALAPTSNNNA
ncbi:MAG: sulfotransferase, partial [Bacteroidota bacterium]